MGWRVPRGSGGLDRRDVELEDDLLADEDATGLERGVPLDAPVTTVDGRAALEAGAQVAERVACGAGVLPGDRHRLGDILEGEVPGHLEVVALLDHLRGDE